MAGLCAVERTPLEALSMRRLDAARRLARRELARFGVLGKASGVAASAMGHAVAFNTLVGGLALDGLPGRLEQEFSAAHLAAPTAGLCQILQQELPPRRGPAPASSPGPQRLGVVQPDLIGEGLVIEALLCADPAAALAAPAVVRRAFAIDEGRASETLIRLAQDFGFAIEDPAASDADREAAAAVLRLLRATAEQIAAEDIRRLAPLVFAIPVETTVMRELALDLTERIAAAALDVAANDGDVESLNFAAIWRGNLSNRLSALGRREDAVRTAEQTVALFRALAESQPDAFASRLAMALDILGNMLRDLGRLEESRAASQEAVSLFIDLSNNHPIAFADKLAIASGNLSATLLKLGRREAATDHFRRCEAASAEPELAALDFLMEWLEGQWQTLDGDTD
jgi:tetratricopeptide (TPR) repeat protein